MEGDYTHLYRPRSFFILDLALTWIPLWLLVAGMRSGVLDFGLPFMIVGGASATLLAVLFVHSTRNRGFIRDFWRRVYQPGRIGAAGWALLLLFYPAVNLSSILISGLWTELAPQLSIPATVREAPLLFLLMTLLYGPLPEELGWRGYGLDALRSRMNLLRASVLLGAFWAVWHLPLYVIPGSFQQQLAQEPWLLASYLWAFFPTSILMSWLYYRNGRSTLSAILFHFAANCWGELLAPSAGARIASSLLITAAAAYLLWSERELFLQREFWIGPRSRRETKIAAAAGAPAAGSPNRSGKSLWGAPAPPPR
jgi:membrane protease YdiL (CAAX protease family)